MYKRQAFILGFVSAVFDNIPLTKLCLDQGGYDWGVLAYACLLYTSDAADERSSVDLGGRRIIKKKKPPMMDDRILTCIHTLAECSPLVPRRSMASTLSRARLV